MVTDTQGARGAFRRTDAPVERCSWPLAHAAWARSLVRAGGVVALAATFASAQADWVVLRNGQKLRGEILSRSADSIELRMPAMTARLALADVEGTTEEPLDVYFDQQIREYLEQGVLRDARRLLDRGRERCAAALAPVDTAVTALEAARTAEAALDFPGAITTTRQALEALKSSARLERELARLEKTKVFFDERGALPGDLIERTKGAVAILHHHPVKAVAWTDLAEAEVQRLVPTMRRSVHHKLPEGEVFVIVIHRDRAEYLEATKSLGPHGLLPDTDEARMTSRSRAATYGEVAAARIPALAARFVALALFEFSPLWLTEGLAGGEAVATREAAARDAAKALVAAGQLATLDALMKTAHYGDLGDFVARERFYGTSRAFVRYVAGLRDGIPKVSRAVEHARNAMLTDLLDPARKHFRLKSYRIEDLVRGYVPGFVPKELGFADAAELERDFKAWIETGKRRGK